MPAIRSKLKNPRCLLLICSWLIHAEGSCPFARFTNVELQPHSRNLKATVPWTHATSNKAFQPNQNSDGTYSLSNENFRNGSVVITVPGTYTLSEDIVFNPNCLECLHNQDPETTAYQSSDVGRGFPSQSFVLGFFAAVIVACNNVTIDLNGFSFEQSREHALQQRFFSIIELASSPFLSGLGPANFGPMIAVQGITIENGTLGLSSHHGIHGNNAKDVKIANIIFKDFEVAAVALNAPHGVEIKNCHVLYSRKDVPVLGTFSNARFIRPYIDYLAENYPDFSLTVKDQQLTTINIQNSLKQAINNVHDYLIVQGFPQIPENAMEHSLFHNPHGVVDGIAYGFLFGPAGLAVGGVPNLQDCGDSATLKLKNRAKNIIMANVSVNNLEACPKEVISLKSDKPDKPQTDPVGAVLQLFNRDPKGNLITISSDNYNTSEYNGNVLSNSQAIVAKAILGGLFENSDLDTSRNSITANTIQWIEGQQPLSEVLNELGGLYCNADTMFHVHKGVIPYKLDGIEGGEVNNCSARNIVNHGEIGMTVCSPFDPEYGNAQGISHPEATYPGYSGANLRAFSLASSKNISLNLCSASNLTANGYVVGFDIHRYSSEITLSHCSVKGLTSCRDYDEEDYVVNPSPYPTVAGINVQELAHDIHWESFEASNLTSCYKSQDILFPSNLHTYGKTCESSSLIQTLAASIPSDTKEASNAAADLLLHHVQITDQSKTITILLTFVILFGALLLLVFGVLLGFLMHRKAPSRKNSKKVFVTSTSRQIKVVEDSAPMI